MVTAEFNPFAPGMLANPYPMYQALRQFAPIYWSELMDSWILTRYEDVDFVLTDPRFSADRGSARNRFAEMVKQQQEDFGPFSLAQTMLTSDPPEHTRLRRLVSKAFTPRAVEDLRPRIQQIVDELLEGVHAGAEFELVSTLAYPLPVIVIAEMLGVPATDREKFKHWSDEIVATLGGPTVPQDLIARARQAIEELAVYLSDHIADRRQNPRNDLISGLVAAEEQGQVLSEQEIFATAILLLVAGNETTTHLISNSVLSLLRNPDELQKLRDDPSLAANAVDEVLRYDAPVQMALRTAREDIEIGGKTIPRGQQALVLLASANRDPEQFLAPDEFDITRTANHHLAFGFGIHFCLGAALARLEGEIAFRALVRRFRGLELMTETPEYKENIVNRGLRVLPVGFSAID